MGDHGIGGAQVNADRRLVGCWLIHLGSQIAQRNYCTSPTRKRGETESAPSFARRACVGHPLPPGSFRTWSQPLDLSFGELVNTRHRPAALKGGAT